MLRSMTGFGTANFENERLRVSVEVKTLNSKFLDANVRLPRSFSDKEIEVRNLLTDQLVRGKAYFGLEVAEVGSEEPKAKINKSLVDAYYKDLLAVAPIGTNPADLFKFALEMPGTVESVGDNKDALEEDWALIKKVAKEALEACNAFRQKEGDVLEQKLLEYISNIENNLSQIIEEDARRVEAVRERIRTKIDELKVDVDENRFEQELVYYIEKLDIAEEKVRLKNHLDHFREEVASKKDSGKKLGFISQEIGREINTIGSKANDAVLQRLVVGMKEELEKIKEQALNIL